MKFVSFLLVLAVGVQWDARAEARAAGKGRRPPSDEPAVAPCGGVDRLASAISTAEAAKEARSKAGDQGGAARAEAAIAAARGRLESARAMGGVVSAEECERLRREVDMLDVAIRGRACEDDLVEAVRAQSVREDLVAAAASYCRVLSAPCVDAEATKEAAAALDSMMEGLFEREGPAGSETVAAIRSLSAEKKLALARGLDACRKVRPELFAELAETQSTRAPSVLGPGPVETEAEAGPTAPAPMAASAASVPGSVGPREGRPAPGEAGAPRPQQKSPQPDAEAGESDASAEEPSVVPVATPQSGFLALDVWQSAWGDFSELGELAPYLRRNGIQEVFLNPGIGMSPSLAAEGFKKTLGLVRVLRKAGVSRIGFLYAERDYPVVEYAKFLRKYPALGISVLVDDSEFTDLSLEQFGRNFDAVRAEGIRYAAFVTLEEVGNSGVSDATRVWAIEHLDEVYLMSYFGCDLETQQRGLERFLALGDRAGRRRSVKIAILMGGKSVGREVSCEKSLGPKEMQAFLARLHGWAKKHPSYGGIVLETNRRMPAYDVAPVGK